MRLRDDDEKLGHVAIAIEGPGYKNCNDHCTLNVMKEIVGSWDLASGKIKKYSRFEILTSIKYAEIFFFFSGSAT